MTVQLANSNYVIDYRLPEDPKDTIREMLIECAPSAQCAINTAREVQGFTGFEIHVIGARLTLFDTLDPAGLT